MPGERLVIKPRWILLAAVLAGCGGGSAPATVAPSTSAKGAVDHFMQAVADSNLDQMAALWGTTAGPSAKTGQPSDYERRVAIMHAYLRNESHRVVTDSPDGPARHMLQVEIRRVPYDVVSMADAIRAADGLPDHFARDIETGGR